jgi:hypothetical protein
MEEPLVNKSFKVYALSLCPFVWYLSLRAVERIVEGKMGEKRVRVKRKKVKI